MAGIVRGFCRLTRHCLADRPGIAVVAASELHKTPERFGLGAFEAVSGRSVLKRGHHRAGQSGNKAALSPLSARGRDHCIETPRVGVAGTS